MRYTKLALFVALLSPVLLTPAFGQRGGGGGHSRGGARAGGGSAVRGGVSGGSSYRVGVSGGTVYRGGVSGGYRGGYYGGHSYYYGGHYYYGGPSFYVGLGGWNYPYYYPYAYAPYYYDPYPYGYQVQAAPPPVQYYPQQAPAPQQQTQPQTVNRDDASGNYFLIAFKDHTIQAATAYKVDGDQIRWMTRDGQEKQAPLSSVDIADSEKLNHDRNVDFKIP